jgi:tetratricopeptide (TPR) repeat protein
VQSAKGDLDGALEAYQQDLAIAQKLAAQDPGNALWQHDLSVSFIKIGDVQSAKGDLDGALKAYQDSLAIREKLAAQDPGNAQWQRDLSVSFNKIGDVQSAKGDLDGALKAYQDSHAIAQKLAAQDPGNAGWQRDLIVSHWKLAEVAESQDGQASEAARHYRAALDIALALRDSGRLAPVDAWMVEELEARLERVSAQDAPR